MRLPILPLLGVLAFAPAVLAASDSIPAHTTPAASSNVALAEDDIEFLRNARLGGLAGRKESELVVQRGITGADRAFAERMIEQHQAMDRELADLARRKNVVLPEVLDEKMQERQEKLAKTKDADLAEEYLERQIAGHKRAVRALEDVAEDSKDADLRAYAAKHLPTLRAHLDEARRLEKLH